MNLLPFIIASLAPIIPPKALQMAMGIAMLQMIVPLIKNKGSTMILMDKDLIYHEKIRLQL